MAELVLTNNVGGSDKEYRFVLSDDKRNVQKYSGRRGSATFDQGGMSVFGPVAWSEFENFVKGKLKKGYRVQTISGKPFMGGSVTDAISSFLEGPDKTSQAPIARKIKKVEVPPQVLPGQMVPIW